MPHAPRDPFADYLEGHDLLLKLERKRKKLEDARVQGVLSEGAFEEAVASVQAAVEKTLILVGESEQNLERELQLVAESAEEGRTLFLTISEKVAFLRRMDSGYWEACTGEQREEWRRLQDMYAQLSRLWVRTLSTEERVRLAGWNLM